MHSNYKKANAAPRCGYVRLNDQRCTQPALQNHGYCRFHDLVDRPLPDARLIPFVEDATSLQLALMQVIRALQLGQITRPVAGTILYALQIASSNLKHFSEELGHPFAPPSARKSARERKEEEAMAGPSLAEYLIERLHLQHPEDDEDGAEPEVPLCSSVPSVVKEVVQGKPLCSSVPSVVKKEVQGKPLCSSVPSVVKVVKEEVKPQPGVIDHLEACADSLGISPTLADFPWDAWDNRGGGPELERRQ